MKKTVETLEKELKKVPLLDTQLKKVMPIIFKYTVLMTEYEKQKRIAKINLSEFNQCSDDIVKIENKLSAIREWENSINSEKIALTFYDQNIIAAVDYLKSELKKLL